MAKPQLKQGVRSADRLRSRMKMPPLVQPSRIKAVATTKTSKAVFLTERENGVVSPAEEDSPGEQSVVMIDVQTGAGGDSRQDKISPAEILQKSGEKDYAKVYEVDLHAEDITRIHNLEKFTKLRILDLSCNQLTTIEKLEQNKLTRLVEEWTDAMDKREIVGCVFLDLRKAFDKVWHVGLLSKLKSYGISGLMHDWFSSYLSDRKQRVVIQGATSTWKSPLAGVPQGSVLGPTLFILYINDLATSRTHCLANLFADDTSLSFSHHSVQRVVATLNRELSTVSTWLSTWKLEANIDKCKVMFITTRTLPQPIPPVTLGGTVLQVVTSHKHLGVTLTNTLSWSQHIEVISNKARRSSGLLCALRRKIPQNLLLRLYITITRPTLEYADIVWAGLTLRDQRTLESVQYQTARLISGHFGIPYPSYNSLYTELSLPSLQFRRKFHTAVTMYKLLNGRCPPHLQSLLPRARASATESRYPLRNSEHLSIPDLRELKLYGNKITDIQNLDRLQELACLQLQHNRIRRLGKGLSCLRKLKILRIDSNDISQLEGKELTANSQLTHLDVSCNKLQELAAVNCLPHLEELNASNNRLAAIRNMRCKKLQDLDLSTNFLTDLSGLKDLHSLTTLNLATNRLSSLTAIGKLRHLQDLNVSNNLLKELGNISEQFPALEVFNVSENAIVSWEQVCLLSRCLQLAELHISGNPFCKERFSYHQELQSQIPSLELLDGLTTKRQCDRVGSAPVMRPMSASTMVNMPKMGKVKDVSVPMPEVVSARQVESQLRNVEQQLSTFQTDLGQRFSSLRATMDSLPVEPPLSARSGGERSDSRPSSGASSRPVSRCSRYSTGHEIRIDFRGTFCGRVQDAVRDFPRESAGRPPGECDTFCGRVRYVQRESANIARRLPGERRGLACPTVFEDWTGSGCNIKGAGGFC
ncbi:hypothetical protein Bbelb_158790 [Branchiostoma belcheri]|nr:hypothetical protein Bbelb_158790 [Branchiostoma belcheri]